MCREQGFVQFVAAHTHAHLLLFRTFHLPDTPRNRTGRPELCGHLVQILFTFSASDRPARQRNDHCTRRKGGPLAGSKAGDLAVSLRDWPQI